MITTHLRSAILEHLQIDTTEVHFHPVSGGDISAAYRLSTPRGSYFVKVNDAARYPLMYEQEAQGLNALRRADTALVVPEVLGVVSDAAQAAILLEWLPPTRPDRQHWQQLGKGLAQLHRHTAEQYGWQADNYIGALPQRNTRCDTWPEFYATQRILPQVRLARDRKLLTAPDTRLAEHLMARLGGLCPEEPPALTHGDLWSGNAHASTLGAALIDPAVSYAHREFDLAITQLFGGFHADFYEAYIATYPLAQGFLDRMSVYQLYIVLVHVNLFGSSYVGQARRILQTWGN